MKKAFLFCLALLFVFCSASCGYMREDRYAQEDHDHEVYWDGYGDGYTDGESSGYDKGWESAREELLEYVEEAHCSISAALDVVNGPMIDPDVPVEDYYDTLYDDLIEALVWLEKIT